MKLSLIPASPAYAEFFLEYRQDPVTRQYNPLVQSTLEELRIRLEKASSDFSEFDKADSFFWFVKMDEKLVGQVNIYNLNRQMLTAELGYGVSANARGHGIASSSVALITRKTFDETPLRKIIAFVNEANLSSRRVLEKVGYRQEGLLREHYLIEGRPVNEAIYGILRGECVSKVET